LYFFSSLRTSKEETIIDWNKRMTELEQRLAAVEYELQHVKRTAQQQHAGSANLPNTDGPPFSLNQPTPTDIASQQPSFNQVMQHGQQQQPLTHTSQQGQQQQPFAHSAQQEAHQQPFAHSAQQGQQQQPFTYSTQQGQQQQPFTYSTQQGQQQQPFAHSAQQGAQQQPFAHSVPPYAGQQWNNPNVPPYRQGTAGQQGGNMESILVKYVMPIVFIVVLLIGILMLFIAGISYGLITEPVRCLLGLLLAAGMYVVGMLQQRFKRPIWGKTLLGGAHGVFIITISIAHLTYELIGVVAAALSYALAFGLIIFSAVRWRSQLLVTIAVISGYLCMFLIDVANVHIVAFILIQLVFSISMIVLSTKLNYRIAYGFAYLLLHCSLLITYNTHEYSSHKLLLAALIIQHLVVFFTFLRRQPIHVEHIIVQIIGAIALISWTAGLYNLPGGISLTYSLVTLILAISYACSLLYFERGLSQGQEGEHAKLHSSLLLRTEVSTIIIAIALLCFFVELLGVSYIGLVLFLIGTSLVLYGLRDEHSILRWFGAFLSIIGASAIIFDSPSKLLSYEVLSWLIMLISIPLIYRECRHTFTESKAQPELLSALLWIEAALIFIFVTIIANLIGEDAARARPYIVSSAWLLYGLAAITFGTVRKLSKARLTGIILLLVIVCKVIFIDITFLNILSKSIIFTVLGGIGILVSFFLYNRTDNANANANAKNE
jgi:hypothetical protein